ncbi:probable magnesium transporter NIPA6 isoform X2 [Rutidosis leptorrhynchoides]|uniref:probable magnesium transporter NIPA6 isoform X2 n=1 Tax=Rutidosis leptorrhynchoides TaxID=125765 RepID=UPI003A99D743
MVYQSRSGIRNLNGNSLSGRVPAVTNISVYGYECRAIGIAINLALEDAARYQTWKFVMVVVTGIITQFNYLNKALDTFNTAVVSPIYYAIFISFAILCSAIMFEVVSKC